MMSAPHVLSIDLGTSGVKAAVVGTDGRAIGSDTHGITTVRTDDGGAEQDPELVWRATIAAAHQALAAAGDARRSIVAVIVSSQYSSIVPVGADGTHVGNMIVWMDRRGSAKRLRKLPGYPGRPDHPARLARWIRIHGLAPIDSAISLSHMRWLRYARPEQYERTTAFLEPMDYLNLRLTGRAAANQCSAFMMLTVDNRTLGQTVHHPELVDWSLIDRDKLPELLPVGAEVGTLLPEVADELGLDPATVVLGGFNDSQAGAIATDAFQGDHAGVSLGTTGVIVTDVPRKKTNPVNSLYTVPGPFGDGHLVSAENGVAGAAIDQFLRVVDDAGGYAGFDEAAASVAPGANGVLYLPWLSGSIAPQSDPRVRAGFVNIGVDTTRADLARAVLEGVALNLRQLWKPVERFAGRELSHVVLYGGGARSDVWSRIICDVLDRPVHRLADPNHAIGVGAAQFAFERLGIIGRDDIMAATTITGVHEPDPTATRRYDELSGHFATAFKRTRPLFHALNPR
jgi:xylulokinase